MAAAAVELRGWVPTRAARALAARVACAVPGIERVINSILVRGEDDAGSPRPARDRPERMTEPLAPQYDPSAHRVRALPLVDRARALRARRPRTRARGEPYVIMMPPPNVTAVLHMGHGLNNTVQDVLVRFERMRGRRRALAAGHRPRRHRHPERGRAAAGQRGARPGSTWAARRSSSGSGQHVRETGAAILEQLKAIGCSARLVAHLLHPGRGPLARRAGGVRPAVRDRA